MLARRPVEDWHDMIGDHTFGETMLDRLVWHSHRLTLTSGSSRRPRTLESPTDYPPFVIHPVRVMGIGRKG
jgi:DNA replication protein DnaC